MYTILHIYVHTCISLNVIELNSREHAKNDLHESLH